MLEDENNKFKELDKLFKCLYFILKNLLF